MVQKVINVGTVANDGTGETLRGAFQNVNSNFTELYSNTSINGPYSNDSAAASGGVIVKGLYYTSDGNVKIRLV